MFEHKMYGPNEILDIIYPMSVRLHLPKIWNIETVFHVSLIEPFIKGNRNIGLNVVLNTGNLIENAHEYDLDKVIGSTDKDRRILYLGKTKGW
jgi:hypothetical protein